MSWHVAPDQWSLASTLLTTVLVFSKRKDWKIQGDILKPPKVWQILKCSAPEYSSIFFFLSQSTGVWAEWTMMTQGLRIIK